MSLAVHNVVQLSDAEVRDRFVVRQLELDELLSHLREPDPPRHALVVGPRGMGKSLLLRRVAVEVTEDAGLAARWLPVVMAEELYEVTSIGELWLAALARLAAIVGDADLVAQHRALLAEPDPSRLETLALQRLIAAARSRGVKVLLLAENLDMLLGDQISSGEGWSLRQALQTETELLLMASAVTTFAQVDEAGEALYGFFHRVDLRPLGDDEVRELWRELTGVDLHGDRAVPIRILTGGNPRLITVLSRFSQQPDLGGLRRDLEMLIDEYTPFFKANIEALPAVERKVFITLADIWAPATAAEVAEQARIDTSKASALLGRLVRRGAVEVVADEPGPRRYELTERLYNLYHLLRRPSGDGRVRALVDILVHLYEPAELERDVWPHIVQPLLGLVSELDVEIASRLHRHLDDAGVWNGMVRTEATARLPIFESLLEAQRSSLGDDHVDTLLTRQQIAFLIGLGGDWRAALKLYQGLLRDQHRLLGPNHPDTLLSRCQEVRFVSKSGNLGAALELIGQVTTDSERVLGIRHPVTLFCRHELACCVGAAGDRSLAIGLFRELAADLERILGPDHLFTLINRYWEAHYASAAGDTRLALEITEDVLRKLEATGVEDHDVTRIARSLRARLTLRAAGSRRSLPRELREIQEILDESDSTAGTSWPDSSPTVRQGRPAGN